MEKVKCTAVVLAAGAGRRMQSDVAKQYLMLEGKPVLWYALKVFEESSIIDDVILVVGKGEIPYCCQEIVETYGFQKISEVIEGGTERYFSVWEALKVIRNKNRDISGEIIFIHDGARPFVTEEILKDTYDAAIQHGACVAAMPVKDTIKISNVDGFAIQTPNRKMLWQVQTPQVFEARLITEAYTQLIENLEQIKAEGIEITDDAMVVESMKKKAVKLVKASYANIKITTPEDMKIAQSLLQGD